MPGDLRTRPVTLCLAGAMALVAALTAWAPRRPALLFASSLDEPRRLWSGVGDSFPPGTVHVILQHADFAPGRSLRIRVGQIDSTGEPFPIASESLRTESNVTFYTMPIEAVTPGRWRVRITLDEREILAGEFTVR